MTPQRRAELDQAYRQTHYHVHALSGSFVFRIDEPCPELAGDQPWAFITACNPSSVWLSHHENAQRMADLERQVASRWSYCPGEGVSPDGRWREASFWIANVSPHDAQHLAERVGQLALVVGGPEPPRLLWTRLAESNLTPGAVDEH
jgi:hypothetical protein